MHNIQTVKHIEDHYSISEVKEILGNYFSTKINLNKIKNLSAQVRFDEDDKKSLEKIIELQHNFNQTNEIIDNARLTNKHVVITTEINIELKDKA